MWDGSGLVVRLEEKELQLYHWVVRRNSQNPKIFARSKEAQRAALRFLWYIGDEMKQFNLVLK